jgi:secreted trypsin-like serine protease
MEYLSSSVSPRTTHQDETCGESLGLELQIVNGDDAIEGEFPSAVNLGFDGEVTFRCGGALIDATHVLTAAHCSIGEISLRIRGRCV